ncbi:23372_t:CDS:2, partial [Racocetra persica]
IKLWTIDHDVLAQGLESESTLKDESTEIKKLINLYGNMQRTYYYTQISPNWVSKKEKKQKVDDSNMDVDSDLVEISASDMITPYRMVRTASKIRSFDFSTKDDITKSGSIEILVSLTNNTLELYAMGLPMKKKEKFLETAEPSKLYSVDLPGHRSDIRTLALNSDNKLLCSASRSNLKIWNMRTTS